MEPVLSTSSTCQPDTEPLAYIRLVALALKYDTCWFPDPSSAMEMP